MKKNQKTSLNKAKELAKKIAKQLNGGEILGLIGPLGSGKTTFTKALGKALKIKKNMPSPTFNLMHRYPIKLSKSQDSLYHLDFYRVKSFSEIRALGIEELWGKKNNVVVMEWADKFKSKLPKKTKFIYFKHGSV